MKLVLKEMTVTDFITQYEASGLARTYGNDWGPLANYSSCNLVEDVCTIHTMQECAADSFCDWDDGLCRERLDDPGRPCAEPQRVDKDGTVRPATNASSCRRFISEKAVVLGVDQDPAAMFYHWWRFFRNVQGYATSRNAHFLVKTRSNTQFFHYFGLLSDNCWRRTWAQVPNDACFCDVETHSLKKKRNKPETADSELIAAVVDGLGLADMPEPSRVRVGLISRRRKRFILNENELVDACLAMNLDVQVLPLEQMTLFEQLAALRSVTILVGIHGSGLNNAIFLPRGSLLLQILPYKLNYKGAFAANARHAGIEYREYALPDPNLAVFHWEFLGDKELKKGKEAILQRGSPTSGSEVYTFWINQDIIVPVDDFRRLILDAVKTSPLNARLANSSSSR